LNALSGKPIDNLFISLGVRPGLSSAEQRDYAFKLIRGTLEVLVSFAEKGMPIQKFYATSERGDGIRLARKLNMKETKYPNDPVLRYELDLTQTDHPMFQPYREALVQGAKQANTK
jgi:hypothetical protein